MRPAHYMFIGVLVISGCKQKPRQISAPTLDQTRKVVAHGIWDREVDVVRDGVARIRVNGSPPFRVFVTSDSVYREHMKQSKPMDDLTEGVFVRSSSSSGEFTTAAKLPLGKYWISIENQSGGAADYQLILDGWYD